MKKCFIKRRDLYKIVRISLTQLAIVLVFSSIAFAMPVKAKEILDTKASLTLNNVSLENSLSDINSVKLSIVDNNVYVYNTIKGTIIDEKGEKLPGVSIAIKGTSRGITTNSNGDYSISVLDDKAVLVFRFVGYESQEVLVGNRTQVDISLKVDSKALEEVIVVGFGTQKRVNLTGAISTVDLKKFGNMPVTNSTQLLQGVQGVYVNQAGGQPGRDGTTIRIRGQGTLNNNIFRLVLLLKMKLPQLFFFFFQ